MKRIYSQQLNEEYYVQDLASGFQVILYPKAERYNKGAFLSVGYGSLDQEFIDDNGTVHHTPPGTAHFLEHKLFENSSSDILEELGRLGANVNAFTAYDNTCYYFTAPDNFEPSLELLLQLPFRREYTQSGVELECDIISREIDMYLDSVDYRSYRNGLTALYPHHPMGQDIAGSHESIKQIDKRTLDLVMDNFYVPENMFLFLIGDFQPQELDQIVKSLPPFYHEYRPKARVMIESDPSIPTSDSLIEFDDTPIPSFDYLLKLEPLDDPEEAFQRMIKYNLILDVLFGKGSDFFQANYTAGVLSDLDVEYHYGQGYCYISFSAEGKKPEQFKLNLEKLLAGFHETGVSMEEVDRIKRKTMGRFLMGFNSIHNIAQTYIAFHYLKAHLFDYLETVNSIVLDDFQNLFQGANVFSIVREETL